MVGRWRIEKYESEPTYLNCSRAAIAAYRYGSKQISKFHRKFCDAGFLVPIWKVAQGFRLIFASVCALASTGPNLSLYSRPGANDGRGMNLISTHFSTARMPWGAAIALTMVAVFGTPLAQAAFPGKPGQIVYSKNVSNEEGTTGGRSPTAPAARVEATQLPTTSAMTPLPSRLTGARSSSPATANLRPLLLPSTST